MANSFTTFTSVRLRIRYRWLSRLRMSRRKRRRERRSGRATALRIGRWRNLRTKCLKSFKSSRILVASTFHGLYGGTYNKLLQPFLNHLFEHD